MEFIAHTHTQLSIKCLRMYKFYFNPLKSISFLPLGCYSEEVGDSFEGWINYRLTFWGPRGKLADFHHWFGLRDLQSARAIILPWLIVSMEGVTTWKWFFFVRNFQLFFLCWSSRDFCMVLAMKLVKSWSPFR